MHCGDLDGKGVQKGGGACFCVADSFCNAAETNTTLQSNCVPVKINFKSVSCLE